VGIKGEKIGNDGRRKEENGVRIRRKN